MTAVPAPHVTVCVCTFRRPRLLRRLLDALARQRTGGLFTWSAVVADNDGGESARPVVERFARETGMRAEYRVEPERNIARARNRAVEGAQGEYIAIIDDDEVPGEEWLATLRRTLDETGVAAALGPVLPEFAEPPPAWVIKGRFCERPNPPTGTRLPWSRTRTGNVLLRTDALPAGRPPFDTECATGGEDVTFFRSLAERGHEFVWCREAPVREWVPPERVRLRYLLRRAFVQGNASALYYRGRPWLREKLPILAKSAAAAGAYTVLLPFATAGGKQRFVALLIKDIHHISRLLSLLGLLRVTGRGF